MFKKLLFGAAAAGAVVWLSKNQETAKRYVGQAKGAVGSVTPGAGREPAEERLNDPALARKVESEIFRPADAPKGQVNVQALAGVVELRGQIDDPAVIEDLERRARNVTGVRDVRNLLHLPGQTPQNLTAR
jgi:osmotically-inducible protein OsmY